MMSLKKVIVCLGFAMLFNIIVGNAADVVCKKDRGGWYKPADARSKAIAARLKVKTCNGGKFQDMVKAKGWTTNAPARYKKKASDEDFLKSLK